MYVNSLYLLLCLKSKVLFNGEFVAQEDILKVFLERNVCVEVYNISKYISIFEDSFQWTLWGRSESSNCSLVV